MQFSLGRIFVRPGAARSDTTMTCIQGMFSRPLTSKQPHTERVWVQDCVLYIMIWPLWLVVLDLYALRIKGIMGKACQVAVFETNKC